MTMETPNLSSTRLHKLHDSIQQGHIEWLVKVEQAHRLSFRHRHIAKFALSGFSGFD